MYWPIVKECRGEVGWVGWWGGVEVDGDGERHNTDPLSSHNSHKRCALQHPSVRSRRLEAVLVGLRLCSIRLRLLRLRRWRLVCIHIHTNDMLDYD